MAVENETFIKQDSGDGDIHPVNGNSQEIKEQDAFEAVAFEIDIEKQHVPNSETANKKENEDLAEDQSLEVQIEDEDSGKDVPDSNISQKQANSYAAKKTVAQGMMDIALITANANQLRYIIEFNSGSSTYYLNLFLIIFSLMLQVGVGVSLIFKGRMDLRGESKHKNAKKINNYVVVGIFLVTIINVFIASFTITGSKK